MVYGVYWYCFAFAFGITSFCFPSIWFGHVTTYRRRPVRQIHVIIWIKCFFCPPLIWSRWCDWHRHKTNLCKSNLKCSILFPPIVWIPTRSSEIHRSTSDAMISLLPKHKISTFTGDSMDWPHFITAFKDLVHDVVRSNSQRLSFLRGLLSPEVRSEIWNALNLPNMYWTVLSELEENCGHSTPGCCYVWLSVIMTMDLVGVTYCIHPAVLSNRLVWLPWDNCPPVRQELAGKALRLLAGGGPITFRLHSLYIQQLLVPTWTTFSPRAAVSENDLAGLIYFIRKVLTSRSQDSTIQRFRKRAEVRSSTGPTRC